MDTRFAPAERLDDTAVRQLATALEGQFPAAWLDAVPMGVLLLDRHRQIMQCNSAFHALARQARPEDVQGKRMGEALNCVHADQESGGCGCSDDCRLCGAAQAILKSLEGEEDCKECRLLRLIQGERSPLDLQVMARPVRLGEQEFSLVTVLDISHEKRLRYLEKTFFHDMVNLAGGLATLTELMDGDVQDAALLPLFADTAGASCARSSTTATWPRPRPTSSCCSKRPWSWNPSCGRPSKRSAPGWAAAERPAPAWSSAARPWSRTGGPCATFCATCCETPWRPRCPPRSGCCCAWRSSPASSASS